MEEVDQGGDGEIDFTEMVVKIQNPFAEKLFLVLKKAG